MESTTIEPSNPPKKARVDNCDDLGQDDQDKTIKRKFHVLILGASYGSLFGIKLLLAGHDVTLVCRSSTAKVFNDVGSIVKMPIRHRDSTTTTDAGSNSNTSSTSSSSLIELHSKHISSISGGTLLAATPDDVLADNNASAETQPSSFDLVVLAMQEPQYSSPDVRALVQRVAKAGLPVMAITNMPLLPYLARIPALGGIPITQQPELRFCYTDPELWDSFLPMKGNPDTTTTVCEFTQCSPDPQAFRPDTDGGPNVLQVRLPTNFKAARFEREESTKILQQLQDDIQNVRYTMMDTNMTANGAKGSSSEVEVGHHVVVEIPVKLRVHDSIMVPLAKWAMLLAGNYRCIQRLPKPIISIQQAVIGDTTLSSSVSQSSSSSSASSPMSVANQVYDWVVRDVCCDGLGGKEEDFVPFAKYAKAAQSLQSPSSAARAVQSGATNIERVDKVVQLLARQRGKQNDLVDEIVATVDEWLFENQKKKNDPSSSSKKQEIQRFYPIGTPGVPWTAVEDKEWRDHCKKQRSYKDDVIERLNQLRDDGTLERVGLKLEEYPPGPVQRQQDNNNDDYKYMAVMTSNWNTDPSAINVLVTGGVHGYETSGVHGAIHFVATDYEQLLKSANNVPINLVVCPCVTPFAYEHIQRWNIDLTDPNRSFKPGRETPESSAVMNLVQKLQQLHGFNEFDIHLDLHETTDTDATEFMPAKHAKAGLPYDGEVIPDGFYLVGDEKAEANDNIREFYQSVLHAVQKVTHLAPSDDDGKIIDIPVADYQEGLILVPARDLGICGGGATRSRYVGTTEVYPDSNKLPHDPNERNEICNKAQSAAIVGACSFLLQQKNK